MNTIDNKPRRNTQTAGTISSTVQQNKGAFNAPHASNYALQEQNEQNRLDTKVYEDLYEESSKSSLLTDAANSGRLWMQKLIKQFIDSDFAQINDINAEQSDLDKIAKYKNLNLQLVQLQNAYARMQKSIYGEYAEDDNNPLLKHIKDQIEDVQQKIKSYDDYFMGEGRTHDAIAQLMFDRSKLNTMDKLYVNSEYMLKGTDRDQAWWNPVEWSQALSGAINWASTTIAQGVKNLIGQGDEVNGYKTIESIKNMDSNDPVARQFLEKLYKGSDVNIGNIKNTIDDNILNLRKQNNERRINELTTTLKSDIRFSKDGKLWGIDIYDPEDIPKQFIDDQSKFGEHWYDYVVHPIDGILFGFPETASTAGLYKHQLKAIGIDGIASILAHEAPTWALSGNKILQGVGKGVQFLDNSGLLRLTTTGVGINAALQSRKEETGLEAIQAQAQRTFENAVNSGADLEKVLKNISTEASRMGIDTSNFDENQLTELAIAYNINTGDQAFDKAKNQSRRGLQQLINQNNSLAIVDYLQTLPFMNYSAKAFRDFARTAFIDESTYAGRLLAQEVRNNYKPLLQSVSDATVGKIAKKFIQKDLPKLGLYTKHIGEYAINTLPLLVGEGISEGVEEINQEILQSRYRRGMYDSYDKPESMFGMHEVFDNIGLAGEGALAYWGVHPQDPGLSTQDIRKAFNVGFISSLMFSKAMHATSNLLPVDANNTRNLLAQLKNDRQVTRLIAEQYDKREDQVHMEMFYDAFNKAGVNDKRLIKSLQDLRDNVDENNTLVKKDYLDGDIRLASAMWFMYNNKKFNNTLKELGVERYSDAHKAHTVLGARYIVDAQKTNELSSQQISDLNKKESAHIDIMSELLSENLDDQRRDQINKDFPRLVQIFNDIKEDYQTYLKQKSSARDGAFGQYVKKYKSIDKFAQNEYIRQQIDERGLDEDLQNSTQLRDANYWYEQQAARFTESERKEMLRKAFQQELRDQYRENLVKNKNVFRRNRYVRDWARSKVNTDSEINDYINKAYNQEDLLNEAVDFAYNSYNNGDYSLEDFARDRLNTYHRFHILSRLKYARDVAKDRDKLLKYVQSFTGLDVDTTQLEGIVDWLESEVKRLEKEEDSILNKGVDKTSTKRTWQSLIGQRDPTFDDQEDFDKLVSNAFINQAIYRQQDVIASAYATGEADPISLRNAIFGKNSTNNALSKVVKAYNAKKSEIEVTGGTTKDLMAGVNNHDLQQLRKQAFEDMLKYQIEQDKKRERIVNRLFQEDGVITPAIEEAADNGNEAAKEAVDEALAESGESAQVETTDDTVELTEPEQSEAERKLAEDFSHQNKNKRKGKPQPKEKPDSEEEKPSPEEEEYNDLTDEKEGEEESGPEEEQKDEPKEFTEGAPEETPEEEETEEEGEAEDETPVETPEPEDEIQAPAEEGQVIDSPENPDILNGQEEEQVLRIPVEDNDHMEDIQRNLYVEDKNDSKNESDVQQELHEEGEKNNLNLPDGWISIDEPAQLYMTDAGWEYDGQILPEDQQVVVTDQVLLNDLLNSGVGINQQDLPEGLDDKNRENADNERIGDFVSQTCFYNPDPEIDPNTGKRKIVVPTINGNPVKFDKPIASGDVLAKKLTEKGWLEKTTKFFIVTQPEGYDRVVDGTDVRDAMAVILVIQDDKNTYLTFLRSLGTTENRQEGKKPHNEEEELKAWLRTKNTDWSRLLSDMDEDEEYQYSDGKVYTAKGNLLTPQSKDSLFKKLTVRKAKMLAENWYISQHGSNQGFDRWWNSYKDKETTDNSRITYGRLFLERAQQFYAKPGKKILSERQISNQIKLLREYRNQIIYRYLTTKTVDDKITYVFPDEIKTDVVPVEVKQSNGRIANKRDDYGMPEFRTIVDPVSSVEEIQENLTNGTVQIAFGSGKFGLNQYQISDIFDNTVKYRGKGLSGKIYWLVEGLSGSSQRVPVMLSEELFDTQVQNQNGTRRTLYLNNPDNLRLCLHYNRQNGTVENVNTEGYLPSAAEILFYMLIHKLNIGINDAESYQEAVEFFIHSGEKTILRKQPQVGDPMYNPFASKQLLYFVDNSEEYLSIALKNEGGVYQLTDFKVSDLLNDDEQSIQNRRAVINAIATQMHWNTDVGDESRVGLMRSVIDINSTTYKSVNQLFRFIAQNYSQPRNKFSSDEDYLNQRVEFLGCPQLSFRLGDFYKKQGKGFASKKNVSILAWMLKEGKLKTDVQEQIFQKPFVFANGVNAVNNNQNVDKLAVDKTGNPDASVVPITQDDKGTKGKNRGKKASVKLTALDLFDEEKRQDLLKGFGIGANGSILQSISNSETSRQEILDRLNDTTAAQKEDRNGYRDRVIIRKPKTQSGVNPVDKFNEVIKQFLNEYNESHKDEKDFKEYKIENLQINDPGNKFKTSWYNTGQHYIIVDLFNNGTGVIMFRSLQQMKNRNNPVYATGVFSAKKYNNTRFDFEKASKWLQDTLGIDKDNIFLQKAVMRSVTDKKIYALTNVALDKISEQIIGYIKFSEDAYDGVEYHEAWHYVNLLLHDKQTRDRIYMSFLESHKDLISDDITIADLEEYIADDFVRYMQDFNDKSLSSKIKKLYNNVLDFIVVTRRRQAYREVYKNIANGRYKGVKLDQNSVKEFHNRYNRGINSIDHYVPGLTNKELDNMPHMDSYQEVFDGTDSVIKRVFQQLNIQSIKQMRQLINEPQSFEYVYTVIDEMIDEQSDPLIVEKLNDLKNNKRYLKRAFINSLLQLGIVAKPFKDVNVQQKSSLESGESVTEKENNPENTWDRFTLSFQRKENASLITKLFMRMIPVIKQQYLDDGTVTYYTELDEFGVEKTYDENNAWRVILDNLWEIDSFADIDEKTGLYSDTSLIGMVTNRAKSNMFFYSLLNRLEELMEGGIENAQLRSQLFATINSSKSQVQLIHIQDPEQRRQRTSYDESLLFSEVEVSSLNDNGYVADTKRQWLLRNDNLISVAKNIPRKWSKNLASKGLLDFNQDLGSVVSKNFVNSVYKTFKNITEKLQEYTVDEKKSNRKSNNQLLQFLTTIKPQIIEFYNSLGIDCDSQSFETYIKLNAELGKQKKDAFDLQTQVDILYDLFKHNNIGSIRYVLDGLKFNIGNNQTTPKNSKYKKDIDEAFNEYSVNSDIGLLAISYDIIHPSSQEFSVKDANDNRLYPINLNNYITDRIRLMNDRKSGYIERMQLYPYAQHSIIAEAASKVDKSDKKSKLRVNTFVGIRDTNNNIGSDYSTVTIVEDYLSKMLMLENDQIVCPTMAGKGTWYSIASNNIRLSHDAMIVTVRENDLNKYIYEAYSAVEPYDENKYGGRVSRYKAIARRWFSDIQNENLELKREVLRKAAEALNADKDVSVGFDINIDADYPITPRFSDSTINRFTNYFLDEINTLLDYYDEKNVRTIVNNKNKRIANYHGKVKNGRMDFSGNGGKFRYFYDISAENFNHKLEALYKLQQKIEEGAAKNKNASEADLYQNVPKTVLQQILNKKDLDGFELIREYLNNLKASLFDNLNNPTNVLEDMINSKLTKMVDEELSVLSDTNKPFQLVTLDEDTGLYIPSKIPEQLLNIYAKQLEKYVGYGSVYKMSKEDQASVLYSLIGNNVVNTITSVIEVEKILSGDPAFYKMKANTKKDQGTSKFTVDYNFGNGMAVSETFDVQNLSDTYSDKIKRLSGLLSPGEELRFDYNSNELYYDSTLSTTKYTNLNVEDIEVPSLFLQQIKDLFKVQLVIDSIRCHQLDEEFRKFYVEVQEEENKKKNHKKLSNEDVINILYGKKDKFDAFYKTIKDEQKKAIEEELSAQMKPYNNITVCDAQVFIRPELYRKIRIALGQWSFEKDEDGYSDEDAYNMIEGYYVNEDGIRHYDGQPNNEWLTDPNLYKFVKKLQLYPLKMSYFQNDGYNIVEDESNPLNINKPIYNKMAIFPLFAFQRSTDIGNILYQRMNEVGNELDMISFKSAVKVGAVQKGASMFSEDAPVEDVLMSIGDKLNAPSSSSINYVTGEITSNRDINALSVEVQDLRNIRMQLNTKAHEADMRAIGTQMFKIAFSNIIEDAYYGRGKSGRNQRTGRQIKQDIMRCINVLSELGAEEVRDRFFENGMLKQDAVTDFVKSIVQNNGIGVAAEELVENNSPAAALVSRQVFENSSSSFVNKHVVDINTKGGTAIQQSVFGFVGHSNVLSDDEINPSYYNGEELKWSASEGSMQVLLSINFFKSVVPLKYQTDYKTMRDWLIQNNIIGKNAKPFGIGYRVPTQGMSSMFAFQVADVLPEQVGDLIVVPREFTAQTGSDFKQY